MFRRIGQFGKLTTQQKRLFLEAYFTLGWKRFLLKYRPFKQQVAHLQHHPEIFESTEPSAPELEIAWEIGRAIRTAARFTPWESACLAQAITGQSMLQKRGVAGSVYLAASMNGGREGEPMTAHAWVKCGAHFITGKAGHERFTVVSSFSW